jgi:hypothetical protein
MRFIITGEWSRNTLLRVIVLFFLFYCFAFWLTNFGLYMEMGLSYQGVVEHYLGSPEKFTRPKSIRGLMEVSHFHLFAMGIFLVSLMHLLLFVPVNGLLKLTLIVAAFTSAFLDEASGWLIVFVSPLFAYMKIASFVVLQLSLITTIALSVWSVAMSQRNAYADSAQRSRPS